MNTHCQNGQSRVALQRRDLQLWYPGHLQASPFSDPIVRSVGGRPRRPMSIVVVENKNVESSTGSESLTPLACPNSNNGNCYNKDGRVTISW